MADADGGGELRVLDKQLLKVEASTHTHTHTHTRRGDASMVALDATRAEGSRRTEPDTPGRRYLIYWLWRCRTDQMDWSVHPLRGSDPRAEVYDGSTLIRE